MMMNGLQHKGVCYMSKFNQGDRVFSLTDGWGQVTKIGRDTYKVSVQFEPNDEDDEDGNSESYTVDGRLSEDDAYPTLFTVLEVAQRFPEYKNKVKKDAWIAVSSCLHCSDARLDEEELREKYPDRQIIKIQVEMDND
jgi:hypothetical protein